MRSHFSAFLLAPVLAGSLLLGGCGGSSLPQTSPVSGTVSYQGKPVEGATVIYSRGARKLSEGEIAIGKTDASGTFTLTTHVGSQADVPGAVPGQYQVTVSKQVPPPGMTESQYQAKLDEVNRIAETGGMATEDQQPPPRVELFPNKYSSAANTELTAEVKADGPNEFKFEL